MSKTQKILVTAVGGDLGQAIVKALKLASSSYEIYGCDREESPVGELLVKKFVKVPSASEVGYIKSLQTLCSQLKLDAIIPASEIEIRTLLAECPKLIMNPNSNDPTPLICQTHEIFDICSDKLKTFEFLNGSVSLVPFADGKNKQLVEKVVSKCRFPLVVKERSASGSSKISLVSDHEELSTAVDKYDKPVVQGYISDENGEFSIGCFAQGDDIRIIIFKRKLGSNGASWWAETVGDEKIHEYCVKVMKKLRAQGSVNIQVRSNAEGIFLLEINPRFSSLVAARAVAGFQDVDWCLATSRGESLRPFSANQIKKIRFKRYLAEVVDIGNGFESIDQWAPRR